MSPFISSIWSAGLIEMPGVEGDALADQNQGRLLRGVARPFGDDQARRMGGGAAHREQQAEASFLQVRRVEGGDLHPQGGQGFRFRLQGVRGQAVGGFVDQAARPQDRRDFRLQPRPGGVRRRGVGAQDHRFLGGGGGVGEGLAGTAFQAKAGRGP
jgi:hypothetical protein